MQSFNDIAAAKSTIPVTVIGRRGLNGVLKLDGSKTSLELLSTKRFHFDTDANGWCDISLLGPEGLKITCHNTVFYGTGHTFGQGRTRMYQATMFPNMIVMDSRGHDRSKKVSQISFIINGMNDFFYYKYTELLDSYNINDDKLDILKSLRYESDDKFDIFEISHLYVCHRPKEIIDFRVNEKSYSIWSYSRGKTFDWHGINLVVGHGATIKFDAPVELDEALESVYEWRQFFTQMSMMPLPIEAVSVAASTRERAIESDVYMPLLANSEPINRSLNGLHPAHIPLNSWEDRSLLAECMKKWLSAGPVRRAFRGRLDAVIRHMREGTRQSDIAELCAGIDSLSELDGRQKFPEGVLDRMASAALEAFTGSEQELTMSRIKGVLGQLQNRSLSEKISNLAAAAFPEEYKQDMDDVTQLANRLRQDATHRAAVREQLNSALQPVVDALACMCVAYDLRQSGVPIFQSGRSARCVGMFFDRITELQTLSHVRR